MIRTIYCQSSIKLPVSWIWHDIFHCFVNFRHVESDFCCFEVKFWLLFSPWKWRICSFCLICFKGVYILQIFEKMIILMRHSAKIDWRPSLEVPAKWHLPSKVFYCMPTSGGGFVKNCLVSQYTTIIWIFPPKSFF